MALHGWDLGRGSSVSFRGAASCEGQDWTPACSSTQRRDIECTPFARALSTSKQAPGSSALQVLNNKTNLPEAPPTAEHQSTLRLSFRSKPSRARAVACRRLHLSVVLRVHMPRQAFRCPRSAPHRNPPIIAGVGTAIGR